MKRLLFLLPAALIVHGYDHVQFTRGRWNVLKVTSDSDRWRFFH